jgi:hypothetical protein
MTEQIDQFFRPDGTLNPIPVKPAKKIAVLHHIAGDLSSHKFTKGVVDAGDRSLMAYH